MCFVLYKIDGLSDTPGDLMFPGVRNDCGNSKFANAS